MISFIIIGRNEGWKLTMCLDSVQNTITRCSLAETEVIYVDSSSTDDSIARAKIFSGIKVYKLTTDYNAAIARNIGVQKACGDIFFFIDGDMEINPDFLKVALNDKGKMIYPFLSGQYINYFYSQDNKIVRTAPYDKTILNTDGFKPVTGGLFMITRELWELVSGMRNKFKTGEDIDLGLRLARNGTKLLRKKEIMAFHHTKDNLRSGKDWDLFMNKSELYGRSMLYRDHIFNRYLLPLIIRNDYGLVVLILTVAISLVFTKWYFLITYLAVITRRSIKTSGWNAKRFLTLLVYYPVRDLKVLLGIIFFYPKSKFIITSHEVQ